MTAVAPPAADARDGRLDEVLALLDAAYRGTQHSRPHDALALSLLHTIDCAREVLAAARGEGSDGTGALASALHHGRSALYAAGYGTATPATASSQG